MIKKRQVLECDVLVVGGGIGGLMAAIAAAEKGVSVMVAEKANTLRSGSGATGNDHFLCYLPEHHGPDIEAYVNEFSQSPLSICSDKKLIRTFAEQSRFRVEDWNNWGIPMKPHGYYEFTGHGVPGKPHPALKYAGIDQKKVLTAQALKRGVTILNKMPINELITKEGEIIGAIGIVVENDEPELQVIRAKSVILATGNTSRLYPAKTPGWMFNMANCPACTGGGRAAAYRAGAILINLDIPHTHAGMKYFNRCGKGTWIGVYRNAKGEAVGQFVTTPTRLYGDSTGDHWTDMFVHRYGQGEPTFMDCSQISDEDLDYMRWGLSNEGNTATLNYFDKEGIDFRKHMVEFTQYEPILVGRGVETDEHTAASLPGLYAAGEETGNFRGDIGGAATYGWIAGNSAAQRAGSVSYQAAEKSPIVQEKIELYSTILGRKPGPSYSTWKEANVAVQQIMTDYAGVSVRSDTLYKVGLEYLGQLKRRIYDTISCENAHEFSRCLEVLDLLDIGELVMICGRERKETRFLHKRVDHPYTSPVYNNKFLTVRKTNGAPELRWRDRQ
ncbi:FAD-dependent oxidoreductase [Chloroflexota bacterium]